MIFKVLEVPLVYQNNVINILYLKKNVLKLFSFNVQLNFLLNSF